MTAKKSKNIKKSQKERKKALKIQEFTEISIKTCKIF
jgi:hypothetical protein